MSFLFNFLYKNKCKKCNSYIKNNKCNCNIINEIVNNYIPEHVDNNNQTLSSLINNYFPNTLPICKKEYNEQNYVVENYEKDLEIAINLSLANKEKNICIICCENKINIAFIPCGHFVCCLNCANNCEDKCPICRQEYTSLQKIYTMI